MNSIEKFQKIFELKKIELNKLPTHKTYFILVHYYFKNDFLYFKPIDIQIYKKQIAYNDKKNFHLKVLFQNNQYVEWNDFIKKYSIPDWNSFKISNIEKHFKAAFLPLKIKEF